MNKKELEYFFKGYFHQDWYSEYSTIENAVQDFIDNEANLKVTSTLIALKEVLANTNLDTITISEYGGYIKPEAFNLTNESFIQKIVKIISSSADLN